MWQISLPNHAQPRRGATFIKLKNKTLHGLILSGGKSRRMGRDKGLIIQDAQTWVNRAGMLLRSVDLAVSVMIRGEQRVEYAATVLPEFELLSDFDLPVGGPLKGLLSFHQLYPKSDVLVLPCDMPNLQATLLAELIEVYFDNPDSEAWIFENQGALQPFPGIYSSRMLGSAFDKMRRGELLRHGLKALLDPTTTARKVVYDELVFQNRNAPF